MHREGKWLVMSTNESSIHLIDTFSGEEKKKLYAKSDGTENVKFTHHESCVLFSSERNNSDIKYLCAYDNRYLRYFKGHTAKVTSISMNPCDDCFLTASLDKSVCLWNLSTPTPIAKLQLPARYDCPYATYDASGMVFGVMCQDMYNRKHELKLFDPRQFDAGPFQEILPEQALLESAILASSPEWTPAQVQKCLDSMWNQFEFSPDGNHILVSTQSDVLLVLDGFRADVEPLAITTRKNDSQAKLGSCMSPTAKYVVTASEDNEVLLYDYKNEDGGKAKAKLCGVLTGHVSPVGCIACNPKYDVMATACVNTVLWIPKVM
jgi:COMPASS component SWD2